jgi:hypothetical protein
MATLKNTTINDTGFVKLPVGTTAERISPSTGDFRYNSSRQNIELYVSTGWESVARRELRSNLIFDYDAYNIPKSNRRPLWAQTGENNQYPLGWRIGADSENGFSANGSAGENARINATDPWGNQAVIWETRASGNGNDDGGWNGPGIASNRGFLYRATVWMKRTSSTAGGTFYHGTSGGGQCVRRLSDSGEECNPYWDCSGTGNYTQNQWYLHVAHIFPWSYTRTARHPETGVYTRETGRVQFANGCNLGEDAKHAQSTSSISQRVYHFYNGDSTTRLHFFDPRVEICDGTQPSIQDLLDGNTHKWYDGSGNGRNAWLQNWPVYDTSNGWLNFDGSNDHAVVPNIDLAQSWTLECWVRHDTVSGFGFFGHGVTTVNQGLHILFYSGTQIRFGMYGNDTDFTMTTSTGVWYQYVFTYDHSNPTSATSKRMYRNGVEQSGSVVSGPAAYTQPVSDLRIGMTYGQGQGISSPADGQWSMVRMYNKVLSAAEVLQNFEADRGRFGI